MSNLSNGTFGRLDGSNETRRVASKRAFGRRLAPASAELSFRLSRLTELLVDLRLILNEPLAHSSHPVRLIVNDPPALAVQLKDDKELQIEIDEATGMFVLSKTAGTSEAAGGAAEFVVVTALREMVIDSVIAQVFAPVGGVGAGETARAADALIGLPLAYSQRIICARALRANRGNRQKTASALGVTTVELGNILSAEALDERLEGLQR